MPKTIACPNCGKPVSWRPDSKWRPFCSERCRMIDLGEWIEGRRRIVEPADDGSVPPESDDDGYY